MSVNMRRIACELNEFKPLLLINSRKNESITAVAAVRKLPSKSRSNVLYILEKYQLNNLLQCSVPTNVLCISDGEIPANLTSNTMINLILLACPLTGKSLCEQVRHIIDTCSGDDYIPQKLLDAVCRGGLQNIADTAYLLLGHPIIIYDLSFKILAFSQNVQPDCRFLKKVTQDKQIIEQTMTAFFEDKVLDLLRKGGASFFFECSNRPILPPKTIIIHSPIFIKGMIVGFVVAMRGHVQWDESDLALTDEISKIISIEIRNDHFYRNSKGLLHEHFLMDMLEDLSEKRTFVEARLQALGLKLHKNMYIVVIRLEQAIENDVQFRPILQELGNIFKSSISTIYKEHIVSLIHCHHDEQALMDTILEKLSMCLGSAGLTAGVSLCFHDLCQIRRHYLQAIDALDIGLSLKKPERIFLFQQLSIYRLFKLSCPSAEIADYFHPAVFCLANYDSRNHTELMKTLYYYMINLKALLKTKDILRIHRNTLVYRINKIQELTNINLEDGETFFQLYISFKGLEYIAHQENREVDFR